MAENCSCVFSILAIHGDRDLVWPVKVSYNTGISNIHVGQNIDRPGYLASLALMNLVNASMYSGGIGPPTMIADT